MIQPELRTSAAEHPISISVSANCSVLTLGRGRGASLANLIKGLVRQTRLPGELVIAVMQKQIYQDLPDTPFPVRQILVEEQGADLPLARARNVAARAATGGALLFLDIDCIPSSGFVADYCYWLERFDGLLMGDVRYLPDGASRPGWTYKNLQTVSRPHSERRMPPASGIELCSDFRCFWSLSFAVTRTFFSRSGGFDERYSGYGGEDTDYGRTCLERNLQIGWCPGARSYHQFHAQHMPPVHQVRSILQNNRIYREKWGRNTMEHWLKAFVMLGLIRREGDDFVILRDANAHDLSISRQRPDQSYASTDDFFRRFADASATLSE